MIINSFNFSIYGLFILLSLISLSVFVIIFLKKQKLEKRAIYLSLLLVFPFILICSFLFNSFSSTGAGVGLLLAVIIFCIIYGKNKKELLIGYTLSLPLTYSIAKLGCFFAPCCYGKPTNSNIFFVSYESLEYTKLIPIQLIESITFMIIFIVLLLVYRKYKSINLVNISIITCAIFKFILDYLRHSHIGKIITLNQIACIAAIIIVLINIIYTKYKKMDIE